jgi:hypothetical protein
MSTLWTPSGLFRRAGYQSESDLEAAINKLQNELFGSNRIYLDVKRKSAASQVRGTFPTAT